MQLCPNGHEIPEWANGVCPRCAYEERNSGRFSASKRAAPSRFLDHRKPSSDSYPSERTNLPPHKQMPNFSRLAGRKTKPPIRTNLTRKPPPKANPQPKAPERSKDPSTFSPQRVLEGIERLIELVSEHGANMEGVLRRAAVKPEKIAEFRDGRHAFVSDVRERWFALFKAILLREEARVIVRHVGLDGWIRPTNMNDLAERCELSVPEVHSLWNSGMRKLRERSNRNALEACVVNSARQFLR